MDTVSGSVEVDLPTRISARGVIAGLLVGLALPAIVMSLGTAIGVTTFPRGGSPHGVGIGFAAWFLLSFVIGAFAGGWVAAGAARALRRRDGVLHGLVTWATMALISLSLVGGVMRGLAAGMLGEGSLGGESGDLGRMMPLQRGAEIGAWGTFVALLLPLLAAVAGGILGASRERRAAGLVDVPAAPRRRPIVTSPAAPSDSSLRPPLPQT